jgi:L-asparaginase II
VTSAVLARVVRSDVVEGEHHGSAVALSADGGAVLTLGSPLSPVFPRSANKPLQAVAMLHAGLALDGQLLALAVASHSGERFHCDGVERILAGAGLDPSVLGNVADLPLDPQERLAWQRAGREPTRTASNCSGKHAAMLAVCVENDWPLETYLEPDHPLQRLVAETVRDLAGESVAATGVDGCGAPLFSVSLVGLARAFARIASAPPGSAEHRVAEAIRTYPEWVGGTGRDVTELVRGVPGLVAKDGAEGVYAAALPDGRAAAVKVSDGAERARGVVMAALLMRLGVDTPVLHEQASRPVYGGGVAVGSVESVGITVVGR